MHRRRWCAAAVARRIPSTEEFNETLRYCRHRIEATGVQLRRNAHAQATDRKDFDEVVLTESGSTSRAFVGCVRGRCIQNRRVRVAHAGSVHQSRHCGRVVGRLSAWRSVPA
ncbi:hypothetical protein BJD12_07275 [Xanthomonas vesicatoria ATCC 35937]|uniref:Uncharacterized protein n=1 Tax=Xanthomonas vesicatoria TaxID=56460 RepID=A0AAJ0IX23_9XANT|nr:hypothetical protein BI313_10030 [Xanthomonas vesicatoria]APP75089.1 hypothetical protein BJD12_07275 [Xanthomonas vesicatoria ATCC 35937]KHM90708.1 hypothetical protein OR60_21330 [Xanthomonas vesicatoria]KHM93361.1 hypothetical protein OR61_14325 [Xanthomonas vesicatoria]KTF34739.1 hypothetical protein LMG920_04985 [Xanthomonas vesicatoria]